MLEVSFLHLALLQLTQVAFHMSLILLYKPRLCKRKTVPLLAYVGEWTEAFTLLQRKRESLYS